MIEVLKQALEALKDFDYDKRIAAIQSVEQAIADLEKQLKEKEEAAKGPVVPEGKTPLQARAR